MATSTTKVALRKPTSGVDLINVVTDINENLDKIDKAVGECKKFTHTAGNLTIPAAQTVWGDLPGAAGFADLSLKAVSGDWIEVGASGAWQNNAATQAALDIATIVASAPVHYVGSNGAAGDYGISPWHKIDTNNLRISGGTVYRLVAGDIENGVVRLRPRARLSAASAIDIFASTLYPFSWFAINLGQV